MRTLSEFRLIAFLLALFVVVLPSGSTFAQTNDTTSAGPESDENRQAEPSAAPLPDNICRALAVAAAANDLPVEFFTRLIWQESRFKPEAVSSAGAQGVAQFMPGTAKSRAVADPFDPFEAIAKSAQLLRDLRREFGNLGLAAAAYNAGGGRVHDWLGGRRPLPGETQAYVRIVTGRSAEEWAGGQKDVAGTPGTEALPCSRLALLVQPSFRALAPTSQVVRPPAPRVTQWGVQVVGGPTAAKALAAYHKLQQKYPALLAGREPHLVTRGFIGESGAVLARANAENRADAAKLCAQLRAAGWYCDVMRN
jgi:hypothetical protein